MNEKLNGIFSYLDINDKTGLASENNIESLSTFQKMFYEQARNKIGVDAVYFLRDEEGVAKIPLIYFSMLEDDNSAKAAKLHSLSWNMGEAPLLFIVTPTETSVYKGYKRDKIEMRGDRAEISDFPLYLNTVAGGLDRRDQTIGGFSFVVKIYAVPVVEIIG